MEMEDDGSLGRRRKLLAVQPKLVKTALRGDGRGVGSNTR